MAHHEIRVRPVVRYLVTQFVADGGKKTSYVFGEHDNVEYANSMAHSHARYEMKEGKTNDTVLFFPCEDLTITRHDDEPKWRLIIGPECAD